MQRTTRGRVIFSIDGTRLVYHRVFENNQENVDENQEEIQQIVDEENIENVVVDENVAQALEPLVPAQNDNEEGKYRPMYFVHIFLIFLRSYYCLIFND